MHISKDSIHPKQKVLSVFSLVMINVIAVDSLRNLAISAEFGFSLVFFYILGAIVFFIPIALTAAELSTGWPKIGGLYVWVREAFGRRWGLVAIWLQWIYNVVWFPTILAFVAGTLAYIIEPSLADNKTYMLSVVLVSFWIATLVNCFGMNVSSLISTIGAIIGTLVPMLIIISLAVFWVVSGRPLAIDFTSKALLPDLSSINNIAFFIAILFGLLGMEMSAVHAEDVKNPRRDYPKALLISGIIIISSLILSSLAIAIVIPHDQISLVSGLIDAFSIFYTAFHMSGMTTITALLIALGALCSVSAWVIGPTKGLLAAAEDDSLPEIFKYTTEKGAPIALLIMQGLLFTVMCSVFLLMPNIHSSYWVLSALTAQLSMLVYLFMFAAAIRLRYSQPDIKRTFRIPGGNIGIWIVGLIGICTCIFAIFIGFFPPLEVEVKNIWQYEAILVGGILVFLLLPLWLYRVEKKLHSS